MKVYQITQAELETDGQKWVERSLRGDKVVVRCSETGKVVFKMCTPRIPATQLAKDLRRFENSLNAESRDPKPACPAASHRI